MSNKNFGVLRSSLCALFCGLFGNASAQAAIIPTYEIHGTPASESATQTYFPAVTNLLTGSTPTGTTPTGGSLSGFTDGNMGSFDMLNNALFYNGFGATVLIPLVTPSDIGQIRSMSGWEDDRVNQTYTISYTTDVSPTLASSFTLIGTAASTYPAPGGGTGSNSLQVTFGDDTSSIVGGSLVTALKLVITSQANGSDAVYREIEAFAPVVPVPEPSSLVLLATGAIALVLRRRGK